MTMTPSKLLAPVLLAALASPACGASDRSVSVAETPDAAASSGGSSGTGGTGGAPSACSPACKAPTPVCDATLKCVACTDGDKDCQADTPRLCKTGKWVAQTACGGDTPVCSEGACVGMKVIGGLVALGQPGAGTTTLRLREQSIQVNPTACGTVGSGKLCVTGGIQP